MCESHKSVSLPRFVSSCLPAGKYTKLVCMEDTKCERARNNKGSAILCFDYTTKASMRPLLDLQTDGRTDGEYRWSHEGENQDSGSHQPLRFLLLLGFFFSFIFPILQDFISTSICRMSIVTCRDNESALAPNQSRKM